MTAPKGCFMALLGPSGSGKTTLLRVIAGFERAQRGEVILGGRRLEDEHTNLAPEKRGIGYVPQEGALFPHLTVAANVGFGLSRAERRGNAVSELLEMVGIEGLAERLPHELSGGEQQRVALARALARRPQVLLLDEPFSSLDASLRGAVREEVHGLLREQGATTVLVTHDQEEALSLADSVAVLRDGRIVQHGEPNEIYEAPVDRQLASFLGAVNVLDAEIEDGIARTPLGALPLRSAGPAASATAAGGGALVMLRPEQLEVSPRAEAAAGESEGGIAGRVEQCRYYGHDALLQIRCERAGVEVLLARVHGEQALPVGSAVTVAARGPVSAL
jgi:iron(III) transport system ATP-binding protein